MAKDSGVLKILNLVIVQVFAFVKKQELNEGKKSIKSAQRTTEEWCKIICLFHFSHYLNVQDVILGSVL